ncbi:hypothetical protein [Frigidibacter sp. MR17.24]|uniref:hypothetical protein n=1 Tax=Frigidibacter sp. MR17.24 TaxID=3127345 RepID=UPI003012EEFD
MTSYTVTLPWPRRELSPNWTGKLKDKFRAKKAEKIDTVYACWAAGIRHIDAGALHLKLTFHPPCNRRRDMDNLIASMKHAIDGIAQATGIDDSAYAIAAARGEARKGGSVVVEITPFTAGRPDAELRTQIIGGVR